MPKEASKTLISQNLKYKVDFVHELSYLLKLQIDHVILDGHGPGMPKKAFETCISKKMLEFQSSYHVTYLFQSESTLYSCLNVKELLDMIRTYRQMHRTDKYSQHSSNICPVWLNG